MSLISGFEHIVRENEPLAAHTRLKIGGAAEYFACPTNQAELVGLIQRFAAEDQPIRLLGTGSGLVVNDGGVKGLVLNLSAPDFQSIQVTDKGFTVGGGTQLSHFVSSAVREGFAGPENLVGIPGTIGGALHHNIGAGGVDMGTWLESATVVTRGGEVMTHPKDSLSFAYRQSSLSELVILSADFSFNREDSTVLTKKMQKQWIVLRARQPELHKQAIEMFKDFGGERATDLISQAGLKGTSVGPVSVLDRDPNYLVAQAGATSAHVQELTELIQQKVEKTMEIRLEPAFQFWA